MSLLSWAKEKFGWGYGRWGSLYGGEVWAGKPVTADGAMQLSAWWRCVKLYAEVTGSLPLKFYQRKPDGDRTQVRDHPIADLIAVDPNIDQTTQEFWGSQAAALAIFGNAYAEKQFVGTRLVALQPLPYDTHPFRDPDTDELKYRFAYGGKTETLPRGKVFHTKGFSLGGDLGISPLAAARQELSISLATEQATGSWFARGLRMSGFFTGTGLDDKQRKQFKEAYIDPITGNDANAHYGILPPNFDFKTINIPPKDAEMLLSRRHNLEEIARFMGVPPVLIGHSADGQTMWGTGVEAIILQWLTMGLDAFLSNIEKSINKRLLIPADRKKFFAEFDRNALLRADSSGRAELYWKLVQISALTLNMVCDKENFACFDGGDVRLVNFTLARLDQLGQKPAARIQPAPGEPIPEPTQGTAP